MQNVADNWRRGVTALVVLFMLVVGTLVAWPEAPVRLLVPGDGWQATGGFVAITPPGKDLPTSLQDDPQARYWRSWSPEHGSQPGTLASPPFNAKGTFAVPYNGFAGEAGVNTYVQCDSSGRRSYLATSRNNTQWSEVVISLPSSFCRGPVRIVAESTSTKDYVALGSPYALSLLSQLKRSALSGYWFLLVAAAVIGGWFTLGSAIASRHFNNVGTAAGGLITLGIVGYALFFLFWYAQVVAIITALILASMGALVTLAMIRGRSRCFGTTLDIASLRVPLLLWLAIATAYFALATMVDSGAGAWEVNGRFSPARWSSDNQLAGFAARALVSGRYDDVADYGPWTLGDRPPLAYGWHAALHAVFTVVGRLNDGFTSFYRQQLAIGVVLNTCWVALMALLLPKLRLSRQQVLVAIIALACFPFFIFNSTFIWPKLLSGALTLTAAWILLDVASDRGRLKEDTSGLVIAAALSALGLQTHGGSAFGIIAMLGLAVVYRGLPSVRGAVLAGGTALAVLIPWSLWQASNNVSGAALLKFAFAGTFGFDEPTVSVTDSIIRSYQQLGWEGWLSKKRDGLMTVMFGLRNTCGINEMGSAYSFIDRWRASDFYYIVPSLNVLVLGFASSVLWVKRNGVATDTRRGIARLLAFGVASIGFSWLTTWDCFINHHQSYQALIAIHVALVVALLMSGRWGMVLLGLGMLYGVIVWMMEPLNHFARFNWISIVVFLSMCLLAIRVLWPRQHADGVSTK